MSCAEYVIISVLKKLYPKLIVIGTATFGAFTKSMYIDINDGIKCNIICGFIKNSGPIIPEIVCEENTDFEKIGTDNDILINKVKELEAHNV